LDLRFWVLFLFWYVHMLGVWLIWSVRGWSMSTFLTILILWPKRPPVLWHLSTFILEACFSCGWAAIMRTDTSHGIHIFHMISILWVLKRLAIIVFVDLELLGHLGVLFQLSLLHTFLPAHKANKENHQDENQTNDGD